MPYARCSVRLIGAIALSFAALAGVPAHAQEKTKAEQAEAQKKLAEVRSKMEELAREQAETAGKRDSANAELAKRANAVAGAAKAVRQTDAELSSKQRELEKLQQDRAALQKNLDGQRAAIADLLRATYTLGRGSDLRLLLGDDDVARVARALAYSKYFQEDRVQKVQKLMGDLARLQDLEARIATEQQALQATKAQRQEQARTLEQQRAEQAKLAAQTDAQYKDQGERLAQLKQNAQSLNSLVDKLQKAIDDAAREAAKAARANPAAPSVSPGKGSANIRGNLPWPANGVVNTYGNGVLIKAGGGSEVRAVARGRVVYAAFLRGYGMLLILNHGGGWLSMYGNNETLLHGVGDEVDAGQAVGTAAAPTGVNTGVYFELRQNNKPVDPRSWLSRQR
ncbi:peptidoglycan DD-metalloendopeptidase family protein [Dyella sp. LX-66]|uniref:murein hydrolase activator EnvC family protein n=1 Tax=unclassified Dyella TaxID=2634549 RepID=UPI001BE09FB4|nr:MULTISPECIES: peptidoglycan DD-metalloendopeptidase family protein [unclassified Dyella]MBT2119417.1 peptidoglycan DD-metalloendopeptidase family protein [Dyella sp. LX-1]MBT2138636.1 peptidoglycan DD-metalloendopeptidase family protein [Dyella sp. LX-66]